MIAIITNYPIAFMSEKVKEDIKEYDKTDKSGRFSLHSSKQTPQRTGCKEEEPLHLKWTQHQSYHFLLIIQFSSQ
jgi:hypothetical protein